MTKVKTPGAEIFKKILNDHVVIEVDVFRYKGQVYIPETARRKPTKGRVIAKANNIDEVEVGDTVLYSQFAGYPLQFQGETTMRVIGISEVIAVMQPESPEIDVG